MNRENIAEYIGNIDDKYLEEVFQHKGQSRRIIMSKKKLVAVIAAAVVAVLMTVSVAAAVAYTGFVGEDRAFGTAMNYVVHHAETEEDRQNLANYILAGLSYDQTSEAQEVSFGLSGLRPVYNVKFKVGGYAYTVKVDAKTEVVLSCDREIDEGWEEYLDGTTHGGSGYLGWPDGFDPMSLKISSGEAWDIVSDYFGFTWSGHYSNANTCDFDFDDDPISYVWTAEFGGKKYICHVNSETGEVSETSIEPIKDYDGEEFEPVHTPDGYLTQMEVRELALEYLTQEKPDVSEWQLIVLAMKADEQYPDHYIVYVDKWTGSFYEDVGDIKVAAATGEILKGLNKISTADLRRIVAEAADIPYDKVDMYAMQDEDRLCKVYIGSTKLGKYVKAVVDLETREVSVLEINGVPQKGGKPSEDALKNQILNLEAPDGMISEAVAAAIAFENSGVNEDCIWALKVDLDGGVYHISYWFGYDDFNETTSIGDYRTNTYEIDAVTGKILSFGALTPDDYIGEEAALAIAYELAGISKEDVEKEEIKFENTAMGYPQYSIKLYATDGTIYYYQLDAISGYDHIVR